MTTRPQNSIPLARVDHLSASDFNRDLIKIFADCYRFIFNNPPYSQYIFFPSERVPISPQQVFDEDKPYIDLEILDGYKPPVNPDTGEEAMFWHDPETVLENLSGKLIGKEKAYASTITVADTGKLAGLIFGRVCCLEDAFLTEEWENPVLYSGLRNPDLYRDLDPMLKKIEIATGVRRNDQIFCCNCLFIMPAARRRGLKSFMSLLGSFFGSLEESLQDLYMFAEMINGTSIFNYVKHKYHVNILDHFFGSDHSLVYAKLKEFCALHSPPQNRFFEL